MMNYMFQSRLREKASHNSLFHYKADRGFLVSIPSPGKSITQPLNLKFKSLTIYCFNPVSGKKHHAT